AFYAKDFGGMVSATGMHHFTRERLERKLIAGRLAMTKPSTFEGVTFSYDARFSAPIPREPTDDELASALASPPAVAASAYIAALHGGILAAFVAPLAPGAAARCRGADATDRYNQRAADMPVDSKVVALEPQTDGSILAKIEGHENGLVIGFTVRMMRNG